MPSDGLACHPQWAVEPASLPFPYDVKAWTLGKNHQVDHLAETLPDSREVGPDASPSGWRAKAWPVLTAESCQPVQGGGKLGEQRGGVQRCVTDEQRAHLSPAQGSGCRNAAQDSTLRSVAYGGSQPAF